MTADRAVLGLIPEILARLHGPLSLDDIARRAGWSTFHVLRSFHRAVGETPKQYVLRLRLEDAATRLATTEQPIFSVAMEVGFASHEVFTRAFRRHFGLTPTAYRAALQQVSPDARLRHREVVRTVGPCVGLFHLPTARSSRSSMMPTLSIARQQLAAQPVLFVRARIARHELAGAIAAGLGKVSMYAHQAGLAFAGAPFTRYETVGPGLLSIEVGLPLATEAAGEGDVESGTLPAGPAVVAMHGGAYDQLAETYAALERWIEAEGAQAAGAPWESYVTDPADHPNPAEWRTEVYWPLKQA